MSQSAPSAGPDLRKLFALFPPTPFSRDPQGIAPLRVAAKQSEGDDAPEYEIVPADEVPPPYDQLLVHEHHMTVTVEAFHQDQVDVRILARKQTGDSYARKILLTLHKTGKVVQFGIMRVNFRFCSPEVRQEIEAGATPLGRILIEHDVLRRIEPTTYLRVLPSPAMINWFGLDRPRPTYGRLAIIHCNGQPAVELLEIVAPAR